MEHSNYTLTIRPTGEASTSQPRSLSLIAQQAFAARKNDVRAAA